MDDTIYDEDETEEKEFLHFCQLNSYIILSKNAFNINIDSSMSKNMSSIIRD